MTDASTPPDAQPTPDQATPAPSRKRRRGRKWLIAVGAVAVALITLVALTPTLVSTGTGQRWVLGLAESAADVEIENASLHVGWLGGQRFAADRVVRNDGSFEATDLSLTAEDASLWSLARGGRVGDIPVRAGTVTIRPDQYRPADERDDPDDRDKPGPLELPRRLAGSLSFTADRITIETPDQPSVSARDVNAGIDLASLREIDVRLSADVQRGDRPAGRVFGDLVVTNAFDQRGQLQPGSARLNGSVEFAGLPLDTLEAAAGLEGRVTPVLGDTLQTLRLTAQGAADRLDATLTLATPTIAETTFDLAREADRFTLRSRSPLRLTVDPAAVARLAGLAPDVSPLTRPTALVVDLAGLGLPLADSGRLDLDGVAIDATATLEPTGLRVDPDTTLELGELVFDVATDRLGESLAATFKGDAAVGEAREPITAEATLNRPLSTQPTGVLEARLPVALADALTKQEGRLAATLGTTLETRLELDPGDNGRVAVSLDVTSGRLLGALAGTADLTGDTPAIDLSTQTPFSLSLAPDVALRWLAALGSQAAAENPRLVLAEPTTLRLDVPELAARFMRTPGGVALDPDRSRFDVVAGADRVVLRDPQADRLIRVERPRLEARAEKPRDLIEILAELHIPERVADARLYQDAGEAVTPGRVDARVVITRAFNDRGELRPAAADVRATVTPDRIPTSVLDDALGARGQLLALLGPVTSARVEADFNYQAVSPIDLTLDTTNADFAAPLRLNPDETITAAEDISFELRPTEATFREVLGEALPMVADALGSAAPIKLSIDGDTLSLPARRFDPAHATINGRLDLGAINMRRDGWVGQTVFGVINAVVSKLTFLSLPSRESKNVYTATFTPAEFSLKDGVATTSEFWLHGSDLAIGFQDARIDVVTDQIEKLAMGITGASFVAGSGGKLGPFVKADQIYTLPVGGSINNVKIDTTWLVIELTGSILSRTAGNLTLGVGGKLFDLFGNQVRDLKTKPMQIDWAPPEPVTAFINEVRGKAPKNPEAVVEGEAGEQAEEADEPERLKPEDVVRDLLGGLLRQPREQRRPAEDRE